MSNLFRNKTEFLCFLYGLTSVLEVFRIQYGPIKLNISDVTFIILWFHLYRLKMVNVSSMSAYVQSLSKLLFVILFFSLNFFVPIMDGMWEDSTINGITPAITFSVKTFLNIVFLRLLFHKGQSTRSAFAKYYCLGFIAAIIVNVVYSSYQMFSWYVLGVDVHTPLMASFGITEDFLGHPVINYVMIPILRSCGLFWDPYYLGILGIIGFSCFIFIKKKTIKLIALIFTVINWLLTFSRTGYVAALSVLFVMYVYRNKNKTIKVLFNFKKIALYVFFSIFLVSTMSVFYLDTDVTDGIKEGFSTKNSIDKSNDGDMRHAYYPLYALESVCRDPFHFIIGYGARNSSRALYLSNRVREAVSAPVSFDIESDWCKCLIDSGIICFIVYLLFHYRLIRSILCNTDYRHSYVGMFYSTAIICVFFGGFFYCINDSRWVWMLYAGGICYLDTLNSHGTIYIH